VEITDLRNYFVVILATFIIELSLYFVLTFVYLLREYRPLWDMDLSRVQFVAFRESLFCLIFSRVEFTNTKLNQFISADVSHSGVFCARELNV
jgi:hypothetical protein